MVQPHSILDIPDEGTSLEPVVGGSGNLYLSIAAAIAGETAIVGQVDRITGVVPQAGTTAGSIVGPGTLSAVDEFYKDYYVVNTDTTPTNGLVSQWARVSAYVGATRTLTLDKPWDFSLESDFVLVKVVRVALLKDIDEDVSSAVGFELNLSGHRLKGKVDCTAEEFHWIRGAGGYITNGVQKSSFGLLKIDDCTVSRRDATIYALLLTNGSNLGRTELENIIFQGVVAGRRGICGWSIDYCRNQGINDLVQGVPYRLVESVAGVAIVLTALDMDVTSEFSGAFIYSENSITGATAYVSIMATLFAEKDFFGVTIMNRRTAVARAVGGATLTITGTSGGISIVLPQNIQSGLSEVSSFRANFADLAVQDFSGTASVLWSFPSGLYRVNVGDGVGISLVHVEGTVTMSGAVTFGGTTVKSHHTTRSTVSIIQLSGLASGTITVSGGLLLFWGGAVQGLLSNVAQTAGAPTFTISADIQARNYETWTSWNFSGTATSVGTYLISGTVTLLTGGLGGVICGIAESGLTGGTFTMSGDVNATGRPFGSGTELTLCENIATSGATVLLSGNSFIDTTTHGQIFLSQTQNGGSAIITGTVTIRNAMTKTGLQLLASALNAASISRVQGDVTFEQCDFGNTVTLIRSQVGGAIAEGPPSLTFKFCTFASSLTDRSGAGTLTWANATVTFQHCHVEGLFTFTGTSFTRVEAFHTRWNGNSGNNAISGSGSRPTTYRLWKCSYNAIINGLTPEVIEDYAVVPANAALTRGNLMSINSSANAIAALATSVVEGILLGAAAGAGNPALLVRRGKAFVSSDAAVVAGDSTVLDVVTTPTNQIKGAALTGQRIARALEATGATIANLAYSEVNLM